MRIWELIKSWFGWHEPVVPSVESKPEPVLEDWDLLKVNSREWDSIIWHHSSTKDGKPVDWEAIDRYHTEVNGWSDIGYHFGVEYVGEEVTVQVGRPLSKSGAHTKGMNDRAVGICVVGDYDKYKPNKDVLDVCIALGKEVNKELGISIDRNFYHNQFSHKSCPGSKFPELGKFRGLLED
jgi:hypothetical protein